MRSKQAREVGICVASAQTDHSTLKTTNSMGKLNFALIACNYINGNALLKEYVSTFPTIIDTNFPQSK